MKLPELFKRLSLRRRREPLIYRYLREEERRYRREVRGKLKHDERYFKPSWRDREAWRLARSCRELEACYPSIRMAQYRWGREVVQFLWRVVEQRVELDAVVRLVEKYGVSDRRVRF
ncbi:MAG: hypothetical protein ABWK05_01985 [Pyrobaculum sp.]